MPWSRPGEAGRVAGGRTEPRQKRHKNTKRIRREHEGNTKRIRWQHPSLALASRLCPACNTLAGGLPRRLGDGGVRQLRRGKTRIPRIDTKGAAAGGHKIAAAGAEKAKGRAKAGKEARLARLVSDSFSVRLLAKSKRRNGLLHGGQIPLVHDRGNCYNVERFRLGGINMLLYGPLRKPPLNMNVIAYFGAETLSRRAASDMIWLALRSEADRICF